MDSKKPPISNSRIPPDVTFPMSDADLYSVLSEIDNELRASNSQASGRELRGWVNFCRRFNLAMRMDDPLAVRIFDWFKMQYGDRLNLQMDFGTTVAQIRHDVYPMRLIRIYGAAIMHCDPVLHGTNFGPSLSTDGNPSKSSLLGQLQGLTREFIKSLTPEECNELLDTYVRGVLGFSRMQDAYGSPFSREALDDLSQSAAHLTAHSPNYGFSRWASLQAAEKLVKGYIVGKGQTPKKTHDLEILVTSAVSLGMPVPFRAHVQELQCSADVRYASSSVGKVEALKAHYAALILCGQIAPSLNTQDGWLTQIQPISYQIAGKLSPIKAIRINRLKRR
jgi:HEPN domain-containing protein